MTRWALAACLLVGCATKPPAARPKAGDVMTPERAAEIVGRHEKLEASKTPDEPLRNPTSLDQVLEILKRDQLDLFGAGVAFAAKEKGLEAEALHAQLELAWGASQNVLVYIMHNVSRSIDASFEEIERQRAAGEEVALDAKYLTGIGNLVRGMAPNIEAMAMVSQTHLNRGADLAKKVIDTYPDAYLGYRLAADYYRSRGDWEGFTKMIEGVRATKPDSNGLIFLLGVAAAERDGDPEKAAEYFEQALSHDPQFVRAQAHLVLVQTTVNGTYEQIKKLEAMNPNHQIVRWAGGFVGALFEAHKAAAQPTIEEVREVLPAPTVPAASSAAETPADAATAVAPAGGEPAPAEAPPGGEPAP